MKPSLFSLSNVVAIGIALGISLQSALVFAMPNSQSLVVAGGCFWCVEADFEQLPGVSEVTSGYTGGYTNNPDYKQVTRSRTGHYEAVKIDFDANIISLDQLLHSFLRSVNPTDAGGQFCDRGESYRTAIFVTPAQKLAAIMAVKQAAKELGKPIVTPIEPLGTFYKAEAYHQDYYKGDNIVLTRFGPRKQSTAYKLYRHACRRDQEVKQLWGESAAFIQNIH